jgi:anti-sigma-K factor RskA
MANSSLGILTNRWQDKPLRSKQLFNVFENASLIAIGVIVIGFSPHISNWERRLSDKHPSTRVTGWSGTWKGILVWRLIGAVLAFVGLLQLVLSRATR